MTKYIYLDDESTDSVGPFIDAVTDEVQGLIIKHHAPKPHSEQLKQLKKLLRASELDGLLLDLRLDQFKSDGPGADYRAATLAQEIRTRATEGDMAQFPIVLWSTDARLRKSYSKDDTSHDLFDLKGVKDDMSNEALARAFGNKMVSLVDGYKKIYAIRSKVRKSIHKFLGLTELPPFLDPRVLLPISSQDGVLPVHEYARFIIRELLERQGPLIDEQVVAARLGIDITASPDFKTLLRTIFSRSAYQGPFAGGWPRWWASLIEDIWHQLPGSPGILRRLDATDRVAFLKKASGLKKLTAFTKKNSFENSAFWTVCQATSHPLDTRDGFMIDKQPPYLWQERLYASYSGLITGEAAEKKIRLDPLDETRYQAQKVKLRNK